MKKAVTAWIAVSTLLVLLSGSQFVAVADAQTPATTPYFNTGILKSPLDNQTYTTNRLMLEIKILTIVNSNYPNFGPDGYYYVTYSIDNGEPIRVSRESIIYKPAGGINNYLTVSIVLPKLSEGSHSLTAYAREPYVVYGQSGYSYCYFKDTVNFRIKTLPSTPSPTPLLSPSPHLNPSAVPTPTAFPSPSASPSQSPTIEPLPSPSVAEFPNWITLPLVAVLAIMIVYLNKYTRT